MQSATPRTTAHTVTLTSLSECQCCGYGRARITAADLRIMEAAGLTIDLRDGRNTALGMSFGHGCGYDIISSDILGAEANGRARDAASKKGIHFQWKGTGTATICRECSQY